MKKRINFLLVFALFVSICLGTGSASAESSFPFSSLQETDIPAYTEGSDYYIEVNDNVPVFDVWQYTTMPFVLFSDLDELGRAGPAYACLGPETLPTTTRGPIGNVNPSGWQSTKYEDLVEGGNLYNRSHLIGHLLCGDNGTKENLITGTRNLNAGSMVIVETAVEMYIQETGHHVLYRVTPFYHGDDLVPFGVQMEAQSMETDGDGICCNLFLYNVQPGIEIDYATGDSHRAGEFFALDAPAASTDDNVMKTVPAEEPEPVPEKSIPNEVTYILNTNTHKFHRPGCKSVNQMKAKNRLDVNWSRDEVIANNYVPCKNCNP